MCLPACVRSEFNLATRRQEHTLTSTASEVEKGRKIARRVEETLPLTPDEAMQARVRTIGERLVAVCDRQEFPYHFAIVEDDEVNAFSLPGGYVFLHHGLVKKTASDDELAGVIAHEIAHITARHAITRYERSIGLALLQLATLATQEGAAIEGVGLAGAATHLANARHDELEADTLAVQYMKAAGFDPTGMLTFLETLHTLDRGQFRYLPRGVVRPHYALTHPFVPDRRRAVKETLFGVADYMDYLNAPD